MRTRWSLVALTTVAFGACEPAPPLPTAVTVQSSADILPVGNAIPPSDLVVTPLVDEVGFHLTWTQNDPDAAFFVLYWRRPGIDDFDAASKRFGSGDFSVTAITLSNATPGVPELIDPFLGGTIYEFAVQVFANGEYSPLSNIASGTTCKGTRSRSSVNLARCLLGGGNPADGPI